MKWQNAFKNLKILFWSLFLLVFPLTLFGLEVQAEGHEVGTPETELKFASWNIRILSTGSRDDNELEKIANIIIDYDFISIVELRDEEVLQRLQKILASVGKTYNYELSAAVGRGVKERVAFLYDVTCIEVVQAGQLYPDDADGKDDFIRDPYWATFRAGKFDFSVIAVHIIWGKRVADRRAEIMALGPVYEHVQRENGTYEDDILLVGDFNRDPSDMKAFGALLAIPTMTYLFQLPQKSHIKDSSLYDNILFQQSALMEYTGTAGIDRFDETDFQNNDQAANIAVSDHRPVWAVFRTDTDDDGQILVDINGDGIVNVLDLILVAASFGKTGETPADVNSDGVVNIQDLVLVAGAFGAAAAAPIVHNQSSLTPEAVQQWLTEAKQIRFTDAVSRRGVAVLEQLLAALTPKETALLANYPNPFNPETWIPYQLAQDADVQISIYDINSASVRQLDLGYQRAGYYTDRNRAAYWDGHNELGEHVATGIYFYQLRADNMSLLRKMVILK